MQINEIISVTELSRLTGRTRPTIYKYIKDHAEGNYDDIPYTFLMLLNLADEEGCTYSDVVKYCREQYAQAKHSDKRVQRVIDLISANADKLDLAALEKHIEEEIKK